MNQNTDTNTKQQPDEVLSDIADYILNYEIQSDEAYNTARNCLIDSIGCAMLAYSYPECTKHLGAEIIGTITPNGSRVFGSSNILSPTKATWDMGCLIRWLDFNDTWLAAEWGHPSDNIGAILAVCDYLSQINRAKNLPPIKMKKVLEAMIKAHEIQGVIALENSFNKVGLDHVLLVRVASCALSTYLYGGNREQIINALSHAFVDGCALRTYRHAPNTMSRKSYAAGDAASRGLKLAQMAIKGEMGINSVLTAKQWGFYDVLFKGKSFSFSQKYGSYVMEQILFKISYPAEFHSQTAIECAVKLHLSTKDKINEIEKIIITTHESAIRIISKTGELSNPADRDHCLQYMVAVALIEGNITADNYEDEYHLNNPLIDRLRDKIQVEEDLQYTKDYLDKNKRSIANAIQIFFKDGSKSDRVTVQYPIGHKRRRDEGIPVLEQKYIKAIKTRFSKNQCDKIINITLNQQKLENMAVDDFMDMFVV
ncbi:MAG: 2-methylcitrate dehydratase [Gammaproteobacteria bacterium]|nr:MAG: 2-methylcitrate dehydratase [Gammaproteobacteria bacterium]